MGAGGNPFRARRALVEREEQLRALDGHLRAAAAGSGRLVLVCGEAGIGKSALVAQFVSGLDSAVRRYAGSCDPLETPRPLGPLWDMATAAGPRLREPLEGGHRHEVLAAFLDLIRTSQGPIVGVFEDVHWADEGTLDLLRVVGRRAGGMRALLVATYRDDELPHDHPLAAVLGDLAGQPAVHRLPVPPLSAAAVRTLADGRHPHPERLHHVTGGNPFFVSEVLAAGQDAMPVTVRDAVLGRVARLSPAARALVEVVAVLGRPVTPAFLYDLAGASPDAVDECARVLRVTPDGLAFRHELARMAVLETIPPGRLAALHTLVLGALRSGPFATDDPSTLAHHAVQSGDVAAILKLCPAAAAHADRLSSHTEAAAHLRAALLFAGGLAPARRAELLERLARHCYLAGSWREARQARQEALALWRGLGDRRGEGDNLAALSHLLMVAGAVDEAAAASRGAIALLRPLPPGPELARAVAEGSFERALANDVQAAMALGNEAIVLSERVGERDGLTVALFVVGSIHTDYDEEHALPSLTRALDLAIGTGHDELVIGGYASLYSNAVVRRRFTEAERWFREGMDYFAGRDIGFGASALSSLRSLELLHLGRWGEAAALAEAGRKVPVPFFRVVPLLVLGLVRARQGDPGAWTSLDAALDDASRAGPLRLMASRAARAEAAFLAGRRELARNESEAGLEAGGAHQSPWLRGELTYWLSRCGGGPVAASGVAEPYELQLEGRWRAAAERWRELGCPYEAARALLDAGEEPALREAHAAFDRLGARGAARLAAQRLRALGARAIPRGRRPATRAHSLGLTSREQEVLELVAGGLTDAEIAARLYLSRKTVSHYVSSILAKLGVDSRRAAGRLAAKQSGIARR